MMYSMTAQLKDGNLVDLNQAEFIGGGLNAIDEAIEAASDAMEYDSKIVAVRVYRGEGYFADYVGTYDAAGWHVRGV